MSDGSVELLPCPFCGGSAAIDDTSGIFSTDCVDCMASNQRGFGSRAEAADAWNTRAQSAEITRLKAELAIAEAQAARIVELESMINTPELHDFAKGVALEAAHQIDRWGQTHDAGKAPADWFWLIGYLAQKAMMSQINGDTDKALHHCVTTAAAIGNWHRAMLGNTEMRPGIAVPPDALIQEQSND